MENKKKKKMSTAELTAGYEDFIKGKETVAHSKKVFDKAIKKAVKPHSAK